MALQTGAANLIAKAFINAWATRITSLGVLLVVQSPTSAQTYSRKTALYDGSVWDIRESTSSVTQQPIDQVRRLGDYVYRIISVGSVSPDFGLLTGQLQRSTDFGLSWSDVGPAPQQSGSQDWGVSHVEIAANDVLWLCATSESANVIAGFEPKVYKSTDQGANWTLVYTETHQNTIPNSWEFMHRIACHPTDANIIAVLGDKDNGVGRSWHTTDGSAFTRHTGSSGQTVARRRSNLLVWDTGRICHVRNVTPIYSDDYGATAWTETGAQPGSYCFDFILGQANGHAYYAGGSATSNQFVKRSKDYGATWQQILNEDDFPATVNQLRGMVYDPAQDVLYIVAPNNNDIDPHRVFMLADAADVDPADVGNQDLIDITENLEPLLDQPITCRGIAFLGSLEVIEEADLVGNAFISAAPSGFQFGASSLIGQAQTSSVADTSNTLQLIGQAKLLATQTPDPFIAVRGQESRDKIRVNIRLGRSTN